MAPDTALDPTALSEGDVLEATYVSVYGEQPQQTISGQVASVETYGMTQFEGDERTWVPCRVEVALIVPADADRRVADAYADIEQTKRIVFRDLDCTGAWTTDHVETRNGARWHRISQRVVTATTVAGDDGGQP